MTKRDWDRVHREDRQGTGGRVDATDVREHKPKPPRWLGCRIDGCTFGCRRPIALQRHREREHGIQR